jgi:hypothetical protein
MRLRDLDPSALIQPSVELLRTIADVDEEENLSSGADSSYTGDSDEGAASGYTSGPDLFADEPARAIKFATVLLPEAMCSQPSRRCTALHARRSHSHIGRSRRRRAACRHWTQVPSDLRGCACSYTRPSTEFYVPARDSWRDYSLQ